MLIAFLRQMYKTGDFLPSLQEFILELNIIFRDINWKYLLCFHFESVDVEQVVEGLGHNQLVRGRINQEDKHPFLSNKKQEIGLSLCLCTCNLLPQPRIILLFHFPLFDLNLYLLKDSQDFKFSLSQFATFVIKILMSCWFFVILILLKFQD